ncbi:uncharacterized protein LOC133900573 isoform X2 [Phragmites australis]|nr:uncharacterized protein LOC133900573 isoform X2 [Phragmites australis]
MCRSTVQGRHLISDDNGYVCSALSIDPWSHCCPRTGARFSCQGCKLDFQCCNSYEYCVSCCLNPSKTKKGDVLKLKLAKPVTAGTYTSVFDFCVGRCRHSSASVVHENAYASDFHHCFSVHKKSLGSIESNSVSRFLGISISVGRPGESCSLVCKAKGQSCVPSRLSMLNKCEILQKYLRCKSGCFRSLGPDQPSEVVDEAPTSLSHCHYVYGDGDGWGAAAAKGATRWRRPAALMMACASGAAAARQCYQQLVVRGTARRSRHVLGTSSFDGTMPRGRPAWDRNQEHAYTCRWMSGSHVMVRINIPRGSVLAHDMGKRTVTLIRVVVFPEKDLSGFRDSFNCQGIDKIGSHVSRHHLTGTSGDWKLKTDGSPSPHDEQPFYLLVVSTQTSHSSPVFRQGRGCKGDEVPVSPRMVFGRMLHIKRKCMHHR